jgi:hypothetical protein
MLTLVLIICVFHNPCNASEISNFLTVMYGELAETTHTPSSAIRTLTTVVLQIIQLTHTHIHTHTSWLIQLAVGAIIAIHVFGLHAKCVGLIGNYFLGIEAQILDIGHCRIRRHYTKCSQ